MKQITILIITLLVVIAAGMWEMSYLKESSSYLLSDISNIYQTSKRNEYDIAKNEAKQLESTWENIRKTWALFMDDGQMNDIGEKITSFVSYIDNEDGEEIQHSYKCLSHSVKSVVEFECLKPENIF